MKASVKLLTLDNFDASRTLKQHAFIPKVFKDRYSDLQYVGNVALCSNHWASDDGEHPTKFFLSK